MVLRNSGCPGAIRLREARPEYVNCPNCEAEVEIWSDEPLARCQECGFWLTHDTGVSCIDWCAKAEECVGLELLERLRHGRPPETPTPVDQGKAGPE